MNKGIIIFAVLIAAGLAAAGVYAYIAQTQHKRACTLEAKLCPDGSYVGRTGPNCEFAACPGPHTTSTAGGGGILPYNSGVRGTVVLGPTCPVERIPPDPNCAPKPYSTLVAIFRATDPVHAFVLTHSDASGAFSASLPPGDYTLGAGESHLPRCDYPAVRVEPKAYATTTIFCDTGIR